MRHPLAFVNPSVPVRSRSQATSRSSGPRAAVRLGAGLRWLAGASQKLFWQSRPYSLPYVAALGVAGAVLAPTAAGTEVASLATAAVFGPSIWILGVVLNDLMHALARPERKRGPGQLLFGLVVASAMILAMSWGRSADTIAVAISALVAAGSYGALKGRLPILASALRGLASGLVVLGGAGATVSSEVLGSVLAITAIDAIGNMLGDYRDREVDTSTGVETVATKWGAKGLHGLALAQCACMLAAPHGVFFVGATTLAVSIILCASDARKHLYYLAWKYVFVALMAFHFAAPVVASTILACVFPMAFAYGRLHDLQLSAPKATVAPGPALAPA